MRLKSSIQRDLDCFFKDLLNEDFNIRKVNKSAFTKARAKLNPWGFKRLNEVAVNTFYEDAPYHTWHKKRVLAVDGTGLMLPNHQTIIDEFGQDGYGPNSDTMRSMALGSVLYDCLNQICIDSEIAPNKTSERDLLVKHLVYAKQGDLLLLDRGYPCFWILFLLTAMKIDFCMRLKSDWWLKAKSFLEGTENEIIVEFELPKKDRQRLDDYPEMQNQKIQCRLVKVLLDTGEIEVLVTSLLNKEEYKIEIFKELYHFRWNEEEAYKMLKCRIELEKFSGKTALSIKQDFHAKILLMTLTAAFAHPIEKKVTTEFKADKNRKYNQKINRTQALAMTREIITSIMLKQIFEKAMAFFDKIVYKTREIIRPNRKNPRKKRIKKKYQMNYKPL
jgi:hypothetical protein